jgi:hypothetical protein
MRNWLRRLFGRPERCDSCGAPCEIAASVRATVRNARTETPLHRSREAQVCNDCLAHLLLAAAAGGACSNPACPSCAPIARAAH